MSLSNEGVSAARASNERVRKVVDAALARGREITNKGRDIDAHQVHSERLAYLATEALAAETLVTYADQAAQHDPFAAECATIFAAQVAARARAQLAEQGEAFGVAQSLVDETLGSSEQRRFISQAVADARIEALGREVVARRGTPDSYLESEEARLTREAVREFAGAEVAPHAERIHRHDELVPESFIDEDGRARLLRARRCPSSTAAPSMGNLAMILTTEELSRASLAAAGSLITRPEILTKALLAGGTEEQKKHWLPTIAAGEIMVGISVTEPDIGSRRRRRSSAAPSAASADGEAGWVITGAKAWCTFAGRANVIALLARTDPDPSKGAQGPVAVHRAQGPVRRARVRDARSRAAARSTARPIARRATAACTRSRCTFERYFVPAENLVGGEGGIGKGFYLQMARLRGRAACRPAGAPAGVAQAALEKTAEYVDERTQFGKPIGELPAHAVQARPDGDAARRRARAHLRRGARDGRGRARRAARRRWRSCFACDVAVEVDAAGAAAARRLGLRRGVSDQPLRGRRAGAADLRGREADPRAQGHRAEPARVDRPPKATDSV